MISARPPNAASGRPPPTIFPRIVRSGGTPKRSCAPPRATRKPVITSSKTSSAPDASQSARSASRKPGAGGTQPMFPATGSTKIAARSSLWRSTAAAASVDVVVVDDDRVGDDRRRHARRGRDAERREARARLGEERVGVAVVAAGELEHAVAAREGAREPERRHRRLGARGDEPHLLDRRHGVDDLGRELDLALGRRAEARPVERRLAHRLDRLGVGVAEDQRPPRLHPVERGGGRRSSRGRRPRRARRRTARRRRPTASRGRAS